MTYVHDDVGNVETITDTTGGFTQGFAYDAIDRLTTVTGLGANSFTYDDTGNRKTKQNPQVTYTYNSTTKRLDSASGPTPNPEVGSYHYDPAGNLEDDPSGTYTNTPFNMVQTARVGGTTTTYRYDGDQRRTVRIGPLGTDYFVYGQQGELLSEIKKPQGQSAAWARDYIYLGGRLVAALSNPAALGPVVAFTAASSSAPEGGTATVVVMLQTPAALTTALTVDYATVNQTTGTPAADFDAQSGQLTFPVEERHWRHAANRYPD